MSSLCQVPMIVGALRPAERLGIVCASRPALDQATLAAVGVANDTPIEIVGMEDSEEFRTAILEGKGWMDNDQMEHEVVAAATQLCDDRPEVSALLLECSDMPPYATAVQGATGVPAWDFLSLIDWIERGVVQRSYAGFI